MESRWILAIAAVGALACSSNSSGGSGATQPPDDTGATGDDTGATTDDSGNTDDTTEPPPCGRNVGDVLCDLQVQGYVSLATTGLASSQPFSTFNLSDVLAQGTQPYAFIFETAFW